MVEGARLESVYTGNGIVGSNPTPSASKSAITPQWRRDPQSIADFRTFGAHFASSQITLALGELSLLLNRWK